MFQVREKRFPSRKGSLRIFLALLYLWDLPYKNSQKFCSFRALNGAPNRDVPVLFWQSFDFFFKSHSNFNHFLMLNMYEHVHVVSGFNKACLQFWEETWNDAFIFPKNKLYLDNFEQRGDFSIESPGIWKTTINKSCEKRWS